MDRGLCECAQVGGEPEMTIIALIVIFLLALIAIATWLRVLWTRREKKLAADKLEFYINMAHEVRTPLTLIKVPLAQLAKEENLSAEGRKCLAIAQQTTDDICDIVSHVLATEREGGYAAHLEIAQCDINEVITHCLTPFRPYAEQKLITLTYEPHPHFAAVWIDRAKIMTILHNLVSNALRYTDAGGTVKVTLLQEDDRWGFSVSDTGIGIPAKEQRHLFDLYYVGSNALQSDKRTGIGLSLVHRLVRLHKGRLTFQSKEDVGTTFTIRFPIGYKYYSGYFKETTPQTVKTPHGVDLTPTNKRHKVVVVEDNRELRQLLQITLQPYYDVTTAENGQEGWSVLQTINADLVISDVMMPKMNGNELCKRIKETLETSHIPVMLLTALGEKTHIMVGLNHLADSYVEKPFDPDILLAHIHMLISNRLMLKEKFAGWLPHEAELELPMHASELDVAFVKQVREVIEAHLADNDFSIDGLASHLNMSRSALFKKLKNLTDQAPHDVIQQVRLNKAASLLCRGHSVTDTAYATGFSDAKYFSKVFKAYFNCTPKAYAKKMEEKL